MNQRLHPSPFPDTSDSSSRLAELVVRATVRSSGRPPPCTYELRHAQRDGRLKVVERFTCGGAATDRGGGGGGGRRARAKSQAAVVTRFSRKRAGAVISEVAAGASDSCGAGASGGAANSRDGSWSRVRGRGESGRESGSGREGHGGSSNGGGRSVGHVGSSVGGGGSAAAMRFTVVDLLAGGDGSSSLLEAARCWGDGEAGNAATGATTPGQLEAWMSARGALLPSTEVTVVFGPHFHLAGYPPW